MAGSVRRLTMMIALAAPGMAALGGAGAVLISAGALGTARQGAEAAVVTAMAGQIAVAVRREAATVEYLAAQALPARAVTAGPSDPLLQQTERRLQSYFPGALGVRLVPRGFADLDESGEPPIGYADLALIRAAETGGGLQPPAVHGFGTDRAYVVLMRSIGDPAAPVGHLLLYLPATRLSEWLAASLPPGGYAQILQVPDGGAPFAVAQAGSADGAANNEFRAVAISGTNWQLAYRAHAGLGTLGMNRALLLFGIVLACGLAAGAVAMVIGGQLSRRLRADLAVLVSAVRDFAAGNPREHYATDLDDVTGAGGAIIADLRSAGGRQSASRRSADRPDGDSATPDIDL